jgi:hypothetical protein
MPTVKPFAKGRRHGQELTAVSPALRAQDSDQERDTDPLRKSLALKRGEFQPGTDELRQLYDSFMQTVRQAAKLADEL